MNLSVIYAKTGKGAMALAGKIKALPSAPMRVLAQVDGKTSAEAIRADIGNLAEPKFIQLLTRLLEEGYIRVVTDDAEEDFFSDSDISTSSIVVEEISAQEFLQTRSEDENNNSAPEQHAPVKKLHLVDQKSQEQLIAAERAKTYAEEQLRLQAAALAQKEAERNMLEAADILAKSAGHATNKIASTETSAPAATQTEQNTREQAEEAKARLMREAEAEARLAAEAQAKALAEAKRKAQEENVARLKRQAEERARIAAEKKAREQATAAARAKAYAEEQSRLEAAALEQREAERKMLETADLLSKSADAADSAKLAEKEKTRLENEARLQAEIEAARKAREAAEVKAEEEALAIREAKAHMDAERKAREEAEHQEREEAKARAKQVAAEIARIEAEHRAREAAEAKARAEAEAQAKREAKAKAEAERKAREAAERKEREEAKARAKQAAAEKARIEAERKAREAAEAKARAEAEAQAKREAKAKAEAERKAREEFEANIRRAAKEKAKLEAEQRAREAAEAKAQAEAEARAKREIEDQIRGEAKRKTLEEAEARAKLEAEEKARIKAEREGRAEAEAEIKAEAKRQAKLEAEARALEKDEMKAVERRKRRPLNFGKWLRSAADLGRNALLSVFVIALVLLVLLQLVNITALIRPLEKFAEENINQPVAIKEVHVALWPQPHLQLNIVSVGGLGEIKAGSIQIFPAVATLFDEVKTLKSIEIEALVLDQNGLERSSKLIAAAGQHGKLKFDKIYLKNTALKLPNLELPAINGELKLSAKGELKTAALATDDHKISIEVTPSNGTYQVAIVAHGWQPPIGPAVIFDELTAKGVANNNEINFSQIDGRLFGGDIKAVMRVNWTNAWNASGNFELTGVNLQEIIPKFTDSTTLTGELNSHAVFSLRATDLSKLADAPVVDASFDALNGSINGINLVRAMQAASGPQAVSGSTRFDTFSGKLQLREGHYQFRQMSLKDGQFHAYGEADISETQTLTGKVNIDLTMKSRQLQAHLILSGTLRTPTLK